MSRILARITRGKIRTGTTNVALVLATAGALYFGSHTIPEPGESTTLSLPSPITLRFSVNSRTTAVLEGAGAIFATKTLKSPFIKTFSDKSVITDNLKVKVKITIQLINLHSGIKSMVNFSSTLSNIKNAKSLVRLNNNVNSQVNEQDIQESRIFHTNP